LVAVVVGAPFGPEGAGRGSGARGGGWKGTGWEVTAKFMASKRRLRWRS